MLKDQVKGFTLIELLVVVVIISILSSVIISNISSARKKSKDASIKVQVKQFETLLALEYSETGSYAGLQPAGAWIPASYTCSTVPFSGNYAVKAREICSNILALSGNWYSTGNYRVLFGNSVSAITKYSILVNLNYSNNFLCLGSSGISTTESTGAYDDIGCYNNP